MLKVPKNTGHFFLIALSLLVLFNTEARAGVTGKISGIVTDAETGEPIAAANVVMVGTEFGASTDLDGHYFIINVSPGTYTVAASELGHVGVSQEGVAVYADFTTTLDFELTATVIQGQEVVVKAERRIIRQDVTASTKIATGDQLYAMPVANYVGALANVGGAVGTGNNIHIRGGRRGEVSYLVDGMEVKDPLLNLRMLDIGSPAVAEMVTMTGGFDAEFGNAQSAVVNVVTKEGSRDYHGQVKYLFDDLSPKLDGKFEQTTAPDGTPTLTQPRSKYQNYDYFEGSLGGPEPITSYLLPTLGIKIPGNVTMFVSGDLSGRNTTSNGIMQNTSEWYRHDMTGGYGPEVRKENTFLSSSAQLTYHINPKMKLKTAYRTSRRWLSPYYFRMSRFFPYDYTQEEINAVFRDWTQNDETYTYVAGVDDDGDGRIDEESLNGVDDDLDGRIDEDLQWYEYNASDHTRYQIINDEQILVSWDHTLNAKTYYNVKLSRYRASRTLEGNGAPADEYGEQVEEFTDMPNASGKYNGLYDPGEPFVDTDGDGIWDGGNPPIQSPSSNPYRHYRGFYYTGDGLSGDIGQLVPAAFYEDSYVYGVKLQLTSQLHRNHQFRGGIDYNYFDLSSRTPVYPSIDNDGWGQYSSSYHVFPSDGAAYAQDKMEFKDVTFTLGARMDFYLPGEQVRHVMALDTTHPDWNPNFIAFDVPERFKSTVSPRLGVSYAITEKAYLHAHYGHFYQRPRWDDMFDQLNVPQTGGTSQIGNPDLDPEKTVAYELGVGWNPYGDYVVDVTGYLKDVKNWINTRDGKVWFPEHFGRQLIGQNYAIWDNQDYAFVRGIEFNLSKDYSSHFSGNITYTLSWVNAKNSYSLGTQVVRNDYVEPPLALPAGWDQRHSIVTNLGLRYGPNQPLFNIPGAPGDWDFNLINTMRSGLPYTPTDASNTRIEGLEMSERTAWTFVTDLNVTKSFRFGQWRTSLWLEIRNLFDAENVMAVDDNYGRAGQPSAFDDYSGEAGWVNDRSSPNDILNPYAGPNQDAWDNPRFIRVGFGMNF